jgi:hypothetical protein
MPRGRKGTKSNAWNHRRSPASQLIKKENVGRSAAPPNVPGSPRDMWGRQSPSNAFGAPRASSFFSAQKRRRCFPASSR